ncbi:MAG TPA: amidohydrolase [Terrimesophilobacter sp.]|uniref:amidohydrolase n=1 Tax=Terrimesophilobacter sp. TaxID=2906435 RepID=UPI002F92C17E
MTAGSTDEPFAAPFEPFAGARSSGSGEVTHLRDRDPGDGVVFTVDECWHGGWLGLSTLVLDDGGFRMATDADPAPAGHLPGTILPGFRDAHVHLGLIDGSLLADGGIVAVDDFGWDLDIARTWPGDAALPEVRFAGRFLTSPGGYPTHDGWAPAASIETVVSPEQAPIAVNRQLDAGATFIKITLDSEDGPVFDDATLCAIVGHAHSRGVTVAAHVQGVGQAERAFEAGVDRLAHSPWTERLDDRLLASMALAQSWVSTLDIHGWGRFGAAFEIASDNVRRFHAAGGMVVYGTDLGNGPLPVGVNERELLALEHAGLGMDAVVAAIAAPAFGTRVSHLRQERTGGPAQWLSGSVVLDGSDLKERLT